jgi:DNA-binding SARP family transcriptional activator
MLPGKGPERFPTASDPLPRLAVLGAATLTAGGQPRRLPPRVTAVLLRLAVAVPEPVPVDQIFRDVWSEPDRVVRREERTAVQKGVLQLRRAIDPEGTHPADSVIEQQRAGQASTYRLRIAANQTDFLTFQRLVEQARRSDSVTAARLLGEALTLWRGRPFGEVAHLPFARSIVRRLCELRESATRELIDRYREIGHLDDALAVAEKYATSRPDDIELESHVAAMRDQLRRQRRGLLRLEVGGATPSIVVILAGDLFAERDAHLVVGFSDTFDTDTTGDLVINGRSLQAAAMRELFGGDRPKLDRHLRVALRHVAPETRETRAAKPHGKLLRYPVGTVAVLRSDGRCLFAVAYSRMGNDLVAHSSQPKLARSLDNLWDAVRLHGQLRPVAMPLVGSGLARIDGTGPGDLLTLVIGSFAERSLSARICPELRIVLHPEDLARVDVRNVSHRLDETYLRGRAEVSGGA